MRWIQSLAIADNAYTVTHKVTAEEPNRESLKGFRCLNHRVRRQRLRLQVRPHPVGAKTTARSIDVIVAFRRVQNVRIANVDIERIFVGWGILYRRAGSLGSYWKTNGRAEASDECSPTGCGRTCKRRR